MGIVPPRVELTYVDHDEKERGLRHLYVFCIPPCEVVHIHLPQRSSTFAPYDLSWLGDGYDDALHVNVTKWRRLDALEPALLGKWGEVLGEGPNPLNLELGTLGNSTKRIRLPRARRRPFSITYYVVVIRKMDLYGDLTGIPCPIDSLIFSQNQVFGNRP